MTHHPSVPSPAVTSRVLAARVGPPIDIPVQPPLKTPPKRPAVGHTLIVDLNRATESGNEAPCSTLLVEHLARRSSRVDFLDRPGRPPRHPELVIGFTPELASAETASRIARTAGAPLILVVQELATSAEAHARQQQLLHSARFVAITSETFRDPVRGYGLPDARIRVLPDWAHVVPTWLDRRDARRALGWPERAFIAVHTGMGPHHDPATVVEAARRAGPEVLMVLVGEGSRRAAVQAQARAVPNALVAGPLDAERRPLSLVAADVLVISEPASPGGLMLSGELGSCLAAGRPVVAVAAPGSVAQTELGRAVGAGLAVPAGGAALLAEALHQLRKDPARRVAMGLAGLAHAETQLSLRRALARFDDIVDAALSGVSPAGRGV